MLSFSNLYIKAQVGHFRLKALSAQGVAALDKMFQFHTAIYQN